MQDRIIEKLRAELTEEFERERQVVYILAEIRKHIEQSPKSVRKKFAALNFFCCWAVHSKGKGAGAERILRRFDEMQPYYPDLNAAPEEVTVRLGKTMALDSFRNELGKFLERYQLPDRVVSDWTCWCGFLALYLAVVEGCPFVLSSTNEKPLTYVEKIVVTRNMLPGVGFLSTWSLIGKDGKGLGSYKNIFTDLEIPERLQHLFRTAGN